MGEEEEEEEVGGALLLRAHWNEAQIYSAKLSGRK